jgi:hypothetical protein
MPSQCLCKSNTIILDWVSVLTSSGFTLVTVCFLASASYSRSGSADHPGSTFTIGTSSVKLAESRSWKFTSKLRFRGALTTDLLLNMSVQLVAPLFVFRICRLKMTQKVTVPTKVYRSFPVTLQTSSRTTPKIRPQPL